MPGKLSVPGFITLLWLAVSAAANQPTEQQTQADPAVAEVVEPPGSPRAEVDRRKHVIESPLKRVVANTTRMPAAEEAEAENPTVEPGKVRWHSGFAEACAAARRSGKPVLLFQMIGRLDQRFT